MNKEEIIERYGEEAWQKKLAQDRVYREAHKESIALYRREYYKTHREKHAVASKAWQKAHPEKKAASAMKYRKKYRDVLRIQAAESNRKDGKYYGQHLLANRTGLRRLRRNIRNKHGNQYKQYKQIIAPESQIHHEWIPDTAEYTGVALVEKEQHMHGFVDVIEILDGKITLLTEEQVRNGGV